MRAPGGRAGVGADDSFARLIVDAVERDAVSDVRGRLLEHPALAAMVRHQRFAGNASAAPEPLLDQIVESVRRERPTTRVLDAWAGRDDELAACVEEARHDLPPHVTFAGTVFFVAGYDIGVAAPPDIVLNAAHEHFREEPSEVGPYATHEAHHVGFLGIRRAPSLTELDDPARLLEVVRYMTQLEGMGVHAAYALRRRRGWLDADDDYRIYTDADEARRVTARYAELIAPLGAGGRFSGDDVGAILTGMSSGERVWYRFGALVAWTLERTEGREALIGSIADPARFERVAAELLDQV